MLRNALALLLAVSFVIHAADDKKEKDAMRLWPRGPEIEKVKAELGLSDAQIEQIKVALTEVEKKESEVRSPDNVKVAEAKVKAAKDALKAAEDELDKAKGGFNLLDERKKAAYAHIPEDKKEKAQDILNYKPKKEKKADDK